MIEGHKTPRPDEKTTPDENTDQGRIEDVEIAHIAALAEDEFRRRLEGLDLKPEEIRVAEEIADKIATQAAQRYREFLQKHPLERLKHKLKEIAEQMRQEGLDQDAEIVEKVSPRIQALIEKVKSKKEELEKGSIEDLQ